mmetsp:Transcript_45274/g.109586  ORF Transcript_45274/g.109586 Transcript_45274/m.109586 type:complete len:148 (+) Transcript_45274:167-610(+)
MSKYELQAEAFEASGISVEISQEAVNLSPSIYDRLGIEGFQELSTIFYNRVFEDDDPRFQSIFSSSTKQEAIENQLYYLILCILFYPRSVQVFCPDLWRTRSIQTNKRKVYETCWKTRQLQHRKASCSSLGGPYGSRHEGAFCIIKG